MCTRSTLLRFQVVLSGHARGIGEALAPTFGGHWVGIGGHWRALVGIGTHKRTYLRSCPRLRHAYKNANFHMQKCIVGPAVSAERRNKKRLQKSQKFPRTETFILLKLKKGKGNSTLWCRLMYLLLRQMCLVVFL